MIPAILRPAKVPLTPALRALRGLAWTMSVPVGLPALVVAGTLLSVFGLRGGDDPFWTAVEALRWVASLALIVLVPWALLLWPLNAQFVRLAEGRRLPGKALWWTAWFALAIGALAWPGVVVVFFVGDSFPLLAFAFGLAVAGVFLVRFGLQLRRASLRPA